MWKKVVAFLRGDVRVRASSTFPERILNICSARGIAFREPRFVNENELAFSVDRRDWRRLKAACADLGAEAHIDAVAGVPFLLGRLRRRYALLTGLGLNREREIISSDGRWEEVVTLGSRGRR